MGTSPMFDTSSIYEWAFRVEQYDNLNKAPPEDIQMKI